MMFLDMTDQLQPMLVGMNVALLVSACAIAAGIAFRHVRHWMQSAARPQLTVHRPVLANHPSR